MGNPPCRLVLQEDEFYDYTHHPAGAGPDTRMYLDGLSAVRCGLNKLSAKNTSGMSDRKISAAARTYVYLGFSDRSRANIVAQINFANQVH